MFAVWIIYNICRGRQCHGLISPSHYHSFIVVLLNEAHEGTAVRLSLMVSSWSLHIIKQPHQPIFIMSAIITTQLLLHRTFQHVTEPSPLMEQSLIKRKNLASLVHFLIIQNTNIELTAWKGLWQELKWWSKPQWCIGAWQLLCWWRAAQSFELLWRINRQAGDRGERVPKHAG